MVGYERGYGYVHMHTQEPILQRFY